MHVRKVSSAEQHLVPALSALLLDSVVNGASIGFLETLTESEAGFYWEKVFASLQESGLSLWIAEDGENLAGSVQLDRCKKANGRHRAEIQKLIVSSSARRLGVSKALMKAAEDFALATGILLLVLDTEVDSVAELVYQKLGWRRSGEVPFYAARPNGELHATVYYFKVLAR
ncbi:MAG: N-acetyltransferase family protein [Acidobacteriota bacterium]